MRIRVARSLMIEIKIFMVPVVGFLKRHFGKEQPISGFAATDQ